MAKPVVRSVYENSTVSKKVVSMNMFPDNHPNSLNHPDHKVIAGIFRDLNDVFSEVDKFCGTVQSTLESVLPSSVYSFMSSVASSFTAPIRAGVDFEGKAKNAAQQVSAQEKQHPGIALQKGAIDGAAASVLQYFGAPTVNLLMTVGDQFGVNRTELGQLIKDTLSAGITSITLTTPAGAALLAGSSVVSQGLGEAAKALGESRAAVLVGHILSKVPQLAMQIQNAPKPGNSTLTQKDVPDLSAVLSKYREGAEMFGKITAENIAIPAANFASDYPLEVGLLVATIGGYAAGGKIGNKVGESALYTLAGNLVWNNISGSPKGDAQSLGVDISVGQLPFAVCYKSLGLTDPVLIEYLATSHNLEDPSVGATLLKLQDITALSGFNSTATTVNGLADDLVAYSNDASRIATNVLKGCALTVNSAARMVLHARLSVDGAVSIASFTGFTPVNTWLSFCPQGTTSDSSTPFNEFDKYVAGSPYGQATVAKVVQAACEGLSRDTDLTNVLNTEINIANAVLSNAGVVQNTNFLCGAGVNPMTQPTGDTTTTATNPSTTAGVVSDNFVLSGLPANLVSKLLGYSVEQVASYSVPLNAMDPGIPLNSVVKVFPGFNGTISTFAELRTSLEPFVNALLPKGACRVNEDGLNRVIIQLQLSVLSVPAVSLLGPATITPLPSNNDCPSPGDAIGSSQSFVNLATFNERYNQLSAAVAKASCDVFSGLDTSDVTPDDAALINKLFENAGIFAPASGQTGGSQCSLTDVAAVIARWFPTTTTPTSTSTTTTPTTPSSVITTDPSLPTPDPVQPTDRPTTLNPEAVTSKAGFPLAGSVGVGLGVLLIVALGVAAGWKRKDIAAAIKAFGNNNEKLNRRNLIYLADVFPPNDNILAPGNRVSPALTDESNVIIQRLNGSNLNVSNS